MERAIEFHNAGGIVTFCWHWNSPTAYLKEGTEENGSPRWWGGFYTRNTDFDISKVMDGSDPEGKARIDEDIAGIAQQLLRLQEAGVPVLWRLSRTRHSTSISTSSSQMCMAATT